MPNNLEGVVKIGGLVDWWGLQWVAPGTIGGLLDWWAGFIFKKLEGSVWKSIPLALLWSIWKCMNDCVFRFATTVGFVV